MAELTQKQYLDLQGLKAYDAKAKARTDAAIKVVDDKVTTNITDITALKTSVQDNASAITENTSKIDANTNKIAANETAIAAINNTETGILKQSKDYTDTTVKTAVETVKSSLASALTYKGQKATVSELPTEGNSCGDVWSVATTDKGTSAEYVWIVDNKEAGTGHWEELGTAVDLSGYATKEEVTAAKDAAIAAAASDATTKANKALADAKIYADSLASNYEVAGAAAAAETNANGYTDTEVKSVYDSMDKIPTSAIDELFAIV